VKNPDEKPWVLYEPDLTSGIAAARENPYEWQASCVSQRSHSDANNPFQPIKKLNDLYGHFVFS
jgi:hypothetical protein